MKKVYLGLGSNVGEREQMLQAAIDALPSPRLRVRRLSPVYETEPVDCRNQRWFLNMVVEAEADLFPRQLLAHTAAIERRLGRRRLAVNGPRTIDIDILYFGSFVVNTPELVIPHPRIPERRFVLLPMADLAPNFRDPATRRSMREMLADTLGQTVRRINFEPFLQPAATSRTV